MADSNQTRIMAPTDPDPLETLLTTLDELMESAEANIVRARLIKQRITHIRREVAAGKSLTSIVEAEPRPLIVELITTNIDALQAEGSHLRWAKAAALRAEGMTVTAIAELFGVSRQRVSALLQQPPVSAQGSQPSEQEPS